VRRPFRTCAKKSFGGSAGHKASASMAKDALRGLVSRLPDRDWDQPPSSLSVTDLLYNGQSILIRRDFLF
jgi:hypothetical protein